VSRGGRGRGGEPRRNGHAPGAGAIPRRATRTVLRSRGRWVHSPGLERVARLRARAVSLLAPLALAVPLSIAAGASTAAAADPATTRVTYLAGGSVYLEAGRRNGLAEGDTLEVLGGGRRVSRLVVRYLSVRRAVCDTLGASRMPAVGDMVRFRPHPVTKADQADEARTAVGVPADTTAERGATSRAASPEAAVSPAPDARRASRLRGRIGARYLAVDPGGGAGYSQPALELKLDGVNVGGAPIDLAVDVRGRRTFHGAAGPADDGEARVYRMAVGVHDGPSRRRLTLGRQLSSALATVSLFDGALLEFAGERWGAGLFSGAEPDPASWRPSGDILQHGAFVTRRDRAGARRWSVTAGGVASFDHGQVNRQYAFAQASWLDPTLSLFWSEELDFNTGWKRTLGEPLVSFTNTFFSARKRVSRELSVHAGYDNRRNVRLYRDRETPETEFDDRHRQGAWLGLSAGPIRHLRGSLDGRWSGGGTAGDYRSLSATAEASRLPVLTSDLHWRSTRFSGALSEGWMHVGGFAVRPWGTSRLDLSAGTRTMTDVISGVSTRTRWEGLDVDLAPAMRWYLLLSVQHDRGDGYDTMQWHAGLSRVF